METAVTLLIILGVISGLTHGNGVLPNSISAAVGEKVTFTTTVTPPQIPFLIVTWGFSNNLGVTSNIITSSTVDITGPGYGDRITLFRDTGTLELRNLTLSDGGEYSILLLPNGGSQQRGTCRLIIYAPVSNVAVTVSNTDLVEPSSSVSLACSSSGSSLSFLWLNGSSQVTTSDRVQLTNGGATLTIVGVTRYDQGPFRCRVFNPISEGTSEPVNLSVNYGPENVNLRISPSQEYYDEGSDVILSCSADSRPAAVLTWYLHGDLLSDTGPELRLMNIQMSQSGNYSCQAFNNRTMRSQTSLPSAVTILGSVSNVKVNASNTDLVESISSVRLSCSSSGSSLSFLWLNGSSEVTGSDRVQLTDGNSTLTIANVTRYDQGPFRCHVFNHFSNSTSGPETLFISYGPDNIILTVSPSQEYYDEGSDIILSCSADSRPAALFTWFLDGDLLSDTGPELRLRNIQMSQSGNYSCQAFNNRTMRNERSQPATISILKKISGASITPEANLPIEGKSFNLTCDASGSVFTRTWKKGDVYLSPDDDINLYDNNTVLSFKNLSERNDGNYSCEVSNPLSSEEATFVMHVNYGPKNVHIEGPRVLHVGQTFTLTCFAESHPSASLIWIVNGTEKQNLSNVFTKADAQLDDSGNYTCEARNDVTGRTSSAVYGLSVTDEAPFRCGAGCIAGIVTIVTIVTLLVVPGAAAVAAYCFYKKKNPMNKVFKRNMASSTGGQGLDYDSYLPNQELHYSDICIFPENDGVRVQQVNNTSEYAQIQVNMNAASAPSFPACDVQLQLKRSDSQPDETQL